MTKDRNKYITCPHCDNRIMIQLHAELKIETVQVANELDIYIELTPKQMLFLSNAASSGLLSAFERTLPFRSADNVPKDKGSYLITVLATARQRIVPQAMFDIIIKHFGFGTISVYTSQGIAIVVVDGKIQAFIPLRFVMGDRLVNALVNNRKNVAIEADGKELKEWLDKGVGKVIKPSDWQFAFSTAIAPDGKIKYYGPCEGCHKYFETHDLLEGHLCDHANILKATAKRNEMQAGLVSPR